MGLSINKKINAETRQNNDVTKKAAPVVLPNDSKSAVKTGESPNPAITAMDKNVKNRTRNSPVMICERTIGQSA